MPSFASMAAKLGAIVVGSVLLITAVQAHADESTPRAFQIAPQRLSSALKEFARQSGEEILVAPALVDSRQFGGLTKTLPPLEALHEILQGTGLVFTRTASGTVLIRQASQSTGMSSGEPSDTVPVRLAQAGVTNTTYSIDADSGDTSSSKETITVFGRGARTDTLQDVPQTAIVFGQDLIQSVQATTSADVLKFIPSASNLIGDYSFGTNFNIRGFRTVTTWNGMVPMVYGPSLVDMANVERMEVLMGPAAVLYGAMQPGAVINFVTKQPQAQFHSSLDLQIGSYDKHGVSLDVGGPVLEGVGARLNASFLNEHAPFDYWTHQKIFVAPVVSFDLSDRTQLILEGSYNSQRYPTGIYDGRVPTVGSLQANPNGQVPISFNGGYIPGATYLTVSWADANIRLKHEFSDALTFNAQFTYTNEFTDSVSQYIGDLLPGDTQVSRFVSGSHEHENQYLATASVTGKFATGFIDHVVTGGVDYVEYKDLGIGSDPDAPVPALDLYTANYALNPPVHLVTDFDYTDLTLARAIFAQDRISLGKHWKLLGGLRYEGSRSQTTVGVSGVPIPIPDTRAQQLSSQAGVIYDVSSDLMFFGSRNTSYQPQAPTVLRDGSAYSSAETAVQYELGSRFSLSRQLSAGVSLFKIEKPNVLTTDPVNPSYQLPVGKVRSQGVELSVNGHILPAWSIYASYGYTDARVVKSFTAGQDGLVFQNTPRQTAAAISRYDFQSGLLQGFGVSAAVNFMGSKFADAANMLLFPSSTRLDLAAYYQLNEHARFTFRANNITDANIYNGFVASYIARNAGRTFLGEVALDL